MIMYYASYATELCDDFFLILKKGYTPETPILSTISDNHFITTYNSFGLPIQISFKLTPESQYITVFPF